MFSPLDINKKNNLAEQSYWDDAYATYNFQIAPQDDLIRKWIEEQIPVTNNGSCIEVGVFPGRFLAVFGELGYELNGVDLTPRVETDLPAFLKSCNYKTGIFKRTDFFELQPSQQFDVVCSFGFIEHFKNWEQVIEKHISLVKKNGYLVITTPNFRGALQRAIHHYLDYPNYQRHFIAAMDPLKWKAIAEQHGFEIKFCGYIGKFEFWVDVYPEKGVKEYFYKKLLKNQPFLSRNLKTGKLASPYIGLVAQLK